LEWLTKIQGFLEQVNDSNIIIGGDLNDYFIPNLDKFNPIPNLAETDYVKAWKATCSDSDLCDIWRILNPNLKRYTWRHGKAIDKLRQSRLDYWLISTHMVHNLNSTTIKPGFRSDHSLIDIKFHGHVEAKRGPSYWRFNANLLRNTEYIDYMNIRIEEIIKKHEEIADAALLWETIKMEIRSSTICFSKKNAIKNKDNMDKLLLRSNELEQEISIKPNSSCLHGLYATGVEFIPLANST
jgi:hypothetical protein